MSSSPTANPIANSIANSIANEFLPSTLRTARMYKDLVEKALAQVADEGFFAEIDDDSNSLAVLVKHLAGNLRSRWQDFLTTDGEKPDRHRDGEFVLGPADTRPALMAAWEAGWKEFLGTLFNLAPEDLSRTVTIRQQPHTVIEAIHRGLTHVAYHAGQIIQLARHHRRGEWQSLSIPRAGR